MDFEDQRCFSYGFILTIIDKYLDILQLYSKNVKIIISSPSSIKGNDKGNECAEG